MTLLAPHLLLQDFPDNSNDMSKNVINTSLFKMGYGPSRTKSAKEKSQFQSKKIVLGVRIFFDVKYTKFLFKKINKNMNHKQSQHKIYELRSTTCYVCFSGDVSGFCHLSPSSPSAKVIKEQNPSLDDTTNRRPSLDLKKSIVIFCFEICNLYFFIYHDKSVILVQ